MKHHQHQQQQHQYQLPVAWRDNPIATQVHVIHVSERMTLLEIAELLPDHIARRPYCLVNEEPVPRELWGITRVKLPTEGHPIAVSFPPVLQGGAGAGNKQIINAVASIAILVAAIVVAPYLAPMLPFAALGISASAAIAITQATLAIGGALILNAFTPPPIIPPADVNPAADSETSATSLAGNIIARGGPLPRVVGTHRVFPPMLPPFYELIGEDTFAYTAYLLAGPHKWENIRVGDVLISAMPDIEYQTREGFSSDTPNTLMNWTHKTNLSISELIGHAVQTNTDTTRRLVNQSNPRASSPKWHPVLVQNAPDEAWLTFRWPNGQLDGDEVGTSIMTPMRFRFRPTGTTTWYYTPEIWFTNRKTSPFTKDVRFIWGTAPTQPATTPAPSNANCPYTARINGPTRVESARIISGPAGANWNSLDNAFGWGAAANLAQTISNQLSAYIGTNCSNFPRNCSGVIVDPDLANGFAGAPNVTLNLRARTVAQGAPANAADGTLLGTTGSFADVTTGKLILSSDPVTVWGYIWIEYIGSATGIFRCRDMWLFNNQSDEVFGFLCDPHFYSTPSDPTNRHYDGGNIATTTVRNCLLFEDRVEFYLDTTTWPKGDYDIQYIRGAAERGGGTLESNDVHPINYNDATNEFWIDFFNWSFLGTYYEVPRDTKNMFSNIQRIRFTQIWNQPPIIGTDFATLVVKVKNQSMDQVSADASGYVHDWNGSAWSTSWTTTSNPAPHYRDVLVGDLNMRKLDLTQIDSAEIVDWRTECITKGYFVNAVLEGRSVMDALSIIASCGFARPRQAEIWDIMRDNDRSAFSPGQVFSHRNMNQFKWEKAFPDLPDGLRIRYSDISNNYQENEVVIIRESAVDNGKYEEMRYEGLVTLAEVERRAERDMRSMTMRSAFYRGETNFQHIVSRRGDLVGLTIDVLDPVGGSAYVKEIIISGPNVIGLTLTGSIPAVGAGSWTPGVAIRTKSGTLITKQVVPATLVDEVTSVTFVTPFTDPGSSVLAPGCLLVSGILSEEYRRMIILDIMPKGDNAQITFIDEAQEIHA